jgi:serine/threonine-protein kinase RsbW
MNNQSYEQVEMRIPAKAEYVGLVRLSMSGILNRQGFSYDDIEDVKIALSEALTNAVKHAYSNQEDGQISVGFVMFEDKIEIIVSDSGKSFDYEQKKRELGPYSEEENINFLREGGLGLFLIETLMDDVKVHKDQGVTISMSKYLMAKEVQQHDQDQGNGQLQQR